jgi:hypothetical protein
MSLSLNRFAACLLLVLALSTPVAMEAQGVAPQTPEVPMKLTADPCFDYFGFTQPFDPQIGIVQDTIPGHYWFYHIPDTADTNISYVGAEWVVVPFWNNVLQSNAGDSISYQFTQNGLDTVLIRALYLIPYPMECEMLGDTIITISGVVENPTTTPDQAIPDVHPVRTFPNPTANVVTIEWADKAASTTEIRLFAIHGQQLGGVQRFTNGKAEIDLQDAAQGSYAIILNGPKGTQRLMVVRQ